MKPRITLITLGVDDLERAVRFYRDGLGLRTPRDRRRRSSSTARSRSSICRPGCGSRCGRGRASLATRDPARARRTRPSSPSATTCPRGAKSMRSWRRPSRRRRDREAGARHLLGRLRRLLPGPGRSPVGSRLESGVDWPGVRRGADPAGSASVPVVPSLHTSNSQPARSIVSKLRVQSFGISIDGYGAGPNQDLQNPLGVRGPELMEWFFHTRVWRQMHGPGRRRDGRRQRDGGAGLRRNRGLDSRAQHVRPRARPVAGRQLEGLVGRRAAVSHARSSC